MEYDGVNFSPSFPSLFSFSSPLPPLFPFLLSPLLLLSSILISLLPHPTDIPPEEVEMLERKLEAFNTILEDEVSHNSAQ